MRRDGREGWWIYYIIIIIIILLVHLHFGAGTWKIPLLAYFEQSGARRLPNVTYGR